MQFEEPARDVNPIVRIDTDHVGIERSVMDLGESGESR